MLINPLKFAPSTRFHKWGDLYFLFIAFCLSSLINWSIHHIHFRDISIPSVSTIAVVILIVAGFVFVIRWHDINRFQVSPEAGYPLTSNGRQLGILLFGIGAFVGPAVTLYLIACYLAFAPLFVDNQGSIKFESLSIAIAFGILISGLLYVLSADIGLPGELTVPIVLLGLAAINLLKQKHRIMPRITVSNYLAFAVLSTLFISYGGTVLVGSLMMGLGDYPPVFFNVDSPLRLTHAHEILGLTEYPPESLTMKGVFRSYHYGGPAAAATIAAITGLAVHKSMFFVALPILLIGSFSAICLLSRSVLKKSGYRYLSIMLFLPFVRFGNELYHQLIYNAEIMGVRVMLRRLVNEFIPFNNYNAEHFSQGIWDVSETAGVFLLTLTAGLLVKRQLRQVLIIAPALVLLTFFTKIAFIPAVSALAGIKLLASWRAYRTGRIFWYVLGSGGTIILVLYLFGTFEAVENSVTLNPVHNITRMFTWQYLADLYAVTGGSALFFLLLYRLPARHQNTNEVLLVASVLVLTYACFMVVILIDNWGTGSIAKTTWIGIPLICMALLMITERSRYHIFVVKIVIAPIFFIALMGQWHKIQQLAVTIIRPDMGHEYVLNRELGQALSTIPKERCGTSTGVDCYAEYVRSYEDLLAAYNATGGKQAIENWGKRHWDEFGKDEGHTLPSKNMIVTNNLQYSRVHQDHQYQITGLFGHQAYATDLSFIGRDMTLKVLAAQRVYLQKAQLSSLFNRSRPEFSAKVVSLAKQIGWTHFLFKKGEMGINLRSPSIIYGDDGSNTILMGDLADPFPIKLRRELNIKISPTDCPLASKVHDGHADNIFVLDLLIPDDQVVSNSVIKIKLIELIRENPEELYERPNTARGEMVRSHALHVGYGSPYPCFNNVQDRIPPLPRELTITSARTRLWLSSRADGQDTSDSRYFVRITSFSPINIPEFDSTDDIPLIKIFENDTYAVYEF